VFVLLLSLLYFLQIHSVNTLQAVFILADYVKMMVDFRAGNSIMLFVRG
jgi:succinate dehydrogenase hydrophobic anchor subunit